MNVIRAIKKMKNKREFQDKTRWAIIDHEGTPSLPAGKYLICPICFSPHRIIEEPVKKVTKKGQKDVKTNN